MSDDCYYCGEPDKDCQCHDWDDTATTTPLEYVPLCPTCFNDANVYCLECGSEHLLCDCTEPDFMYCVPCSEEFFFDRYTKRSISIDAYAAEANAAPVVEEDGRFYWPNGDELKCRCYKPKALRCESCCVQRASVKDTWAYLPPAEFEPVTASSSPTSSFHHQFYASDRHYHHPVRLNTVTVFASSLNYNARETPDPDFGLYADWSWKPRWRNELIDWQDFGLPYNQHLAYDQIYDAFERALEGQIVEVGCIGGHGRTGTILACMATLDGMQPEEAIDHIRSTYCQMAIESTSQEFYVEWFHAKFTGIEMPEIKVPDPVLSSKNDLDACSMREHWDAWKSGAKSCLRCDLWTMDVARFKTGAIKFVNEVAE
jgi:hypothetical protein